MFSDRFKFPKYFLPLSTQQGLIGPTPARWKLHANAHVVDPRMPRRGGGAKIPFVGKNDAFRIKVVEGGSRRKGQESEPKSPMVSCSSLRISKRRKLDKKVLIQIY